MKERDCVLETEDIIKTYKGFRALDGLTMRVPRGAVYGLVGRNGAGKTTLIRLICGLQEPSAGSFRLFGIPHDGKEIVRARRRMGAVVETPALYRDLTAEENLRQEFLIRGIPSFEGIPDLIRLVGLEGAGRKKVRHYSLGMKQRLGLALALAGEPDFLVLDEPVNGLDPQGIVEIRELILKLNREKEITFLISSHILDELSRLATHYGIMDRGRMVRELSAEDLEGALRRCLRLEVTDPAVLARVLDSMGISYKILSGGKADVYAGISVTDLTLALAGEGCGVLTLQERDESLESYFLSLTEGGRS